MYEFGHVHQMFTTYTSPVHYKYIKSHIYITGTSYHSLLNRRKLQVREGQSIQYLRGSQLNMLWSILKKKLVNTFWPMIHGQCLLSRRMIHGQCLLSSLLCTNTIHVHQIFAICTSSVTYKYIKSLINIKVGFLAISYTNMKCDLCISNLFQ